MTMSNGNQERSDWTNLCGDDGRVKARFNRRTFELVVKERGVYHSWRLATMVKLGQDATDSQMPIEMTISK